MYERKTPLFLDCGLHLTREVLNGKWKPLLLYSISMDVRRPSELLRMLPEATRRVLTVQLKELELHGVIEKKIYPELPPKVEYSLTAIGQSLLPIIEALNAWGDAHREFLETVIANEGNAGQVSKSPCEVYQQLQPEHSVGELLQ